MTTTYLCFTEKKNFFKIRHFFQCIHSSAESEDTKYSKAAEWRNCTDVLTLPREEARRTNLPQSDGPLLNRAAVEKKREKAKPDLDTNTIQVCFASRSPWEVLEWRKIVNFKKNIVRIREIYTTIAKSLNLKMISLIGTLDEP